MQPNLPVSVRFGARPPGVVIDATFALSPMGLLVAMALSRTANVWLPRALCTLLDNDTHYRRHNSAMGGGWLPELLRATLLPELALELEPWRKAWQNGRLSSRVHWIGDAQYESALPDREEGGLLARYEGCCSALDARLGALAGLASPLEECARDVIALAAALQPESVYILCGTAPGTGEPLLGGYLEQLGFPVQRQPAGFADLASGALAPAMPAMLASGGTAAVIQVIAPVILAMPDGWDDSSWSLDDLPDGDEDGLDDPWRNACALWRPLATWTEAAA